ncbi:hypothetical protein CU276_13195 [Yersinia kristensenii]|nr:hypothetical protein CU276_13195 [Yersinia kristensenii]
MPCNIPVILQAACALATFITRITYSCKLIGFSRLPPSRNLNYFGYRNPQKNGNVKNYIGR